MPACQFTSIDAKHSQQSAVTEVRQALDVYTTYLNYGNQSVVLAHFMFSDAPACFNVRYDKL